MWRALKEAHEGNSAGSRIYWLEKLVTFKMESSDVPVELDQIVTMEERLNALVSSSRPLSVDEILSMSACLMLPSSFKPTITPLLQRDSITSTQLISSIREEITRSSIAYPGPFSSVSESVNKAVELKPVKKLKHCNYCR